MSYVTHSKAVSIHFAICLLTLGVQLLHAPWTKAPPPGAGQPVSLGFRWMDVPVVSDGPAPRVKTLRDPIGQDQLRRPLKPTDRAQIQKAIEIADGGDHHLAIKLLGELLARHPQTKPYVASVRGAEFLGVGRWIDAERDLADAMILLPHSPMNYSNFALALMNNSEWGAAEVVVRRSLALGNSEQAEKILAIIEGRKRLPEARKQ